MTENDVNPPINNDPMEKRNEFIDHPSYLRDKSIGTKHYEIRRIWNSDDVISGFLWI